MIHTVRKKGRPRIIYTKGFRGALESIRVGDMDTSGNARVLAVLERSRPEEDRRRGPISSDAELSRLSTLDLHLSLPRVPSVFLRMTNLRSLRLVHADVDDIRNLFHLQNLSFLDLSFNFVRDISGISSLVRLEHLILDANPLRLLEPTNFAGMDKLSSLSVRRTLLTNLRQAFFALRPSVLPSLVHLSFCGQDELRTGLAGRELRGVGNLHMDGDLEDVESVHSDGLYSDADNAHLERFAVSDDEGGTVSVDWDTFLERVRRDLARGVHFDGIDAEREDSGEDDGSVSPIGRSFGGVSDHETEDDNRSDSFLDDVVECTPLVFHPFYRHFLVHSFCGPTECPRIRRLEVLDGRKVTESEIAVAQVFFSWHFEHRLYESADSFPVAAVLAAREAGFPGLGLTRTNAVQYRRRATRARQFSVSDGDEMGTAFPFAARHFSGSRYSYRNGLLSSLGQQSNLIFPKCKNLVPHHLPRMMELHPSVPDQLVVGTLDGKLLVVDGDSCRVLGECDTHDHRNILGLCWLRNNPERFVYGNDIGTIGLVNSDAIVTGINPFVHRFDRFPELTSVSVNSEDDLVAASGFGSDIAVYDLATGVVRRKFSNAHEAHVNIVKFQFENPMVMGSCSFDRTAKLWDLRTDLSKPIFQHVSMHPNVMMCFSPDDRFMLVSAVDNEIRQLEAADGSLHTLFETPKRLRSRNYTRTYYLNYRDYIVSGSCAETTVNIYNAITGKFLTSVEMDHRLEQTDEMYIQSLRGDLFRPFAFVVLTSHLGVRQFGTELISVNLLGSDCTQLR